MRTLVWVSCIVTLGGAPLLVGGCSETDPIGDPVQFQTLTVAYGDPGLNATPCDDALPILDGVGTNSEWSDAPPLIVRMTGANGNGGGEFFLELRGLWTDEGRLDGDDRIYFLVRYADDDLDRLPDQLGYGTQNPATGEIIPSPVVQDDYPCGGDRLAGPHMQTANWTRLNQGGREDQVMMLLARVDDPSQPSDLIEINQVLLGQVGNEVPSSFSGQGGENVDVWVWRAGRTNLHPVPQFANWTDFQDGDDFLPKPANSRFEFTTGFAEDLWIDAGGVLKPDIGISPYTKNFNDTGNPIQNPMPIPVRLHACPPPGREPTEEELGELNRGLPHDQALWDGDAKAMQCGQTLACSRAGSPSNWSRGLSLGEFDYVQGWRLRVPYSPQRPFDVSSRDVRARGTYETTQGRGFPVHTVEVMRNFNTGNSDDLVITPSAEGTPPAMIYRLVIGVYDNSGKIGSGSTEVYLRFEGRTTKIGQVDRC